MENNADSHDATKVAARPLAELLACSPEATRLLEQSSECIAFDVGQTIFHQGENCRGLYVVVSGDLQRRTEWKKSRLTLGMVRAGELLEIASVLGDGKHTCSLIAKTEGVLMLLPIAALQEAFAAFPPLHAQLLAELAREVSRGYAAGITVRSKTRRASHTRAVPEESATRHVD